MRQAERGRKLRGTVDIHRLSGVAADAVPSTGDSGSYAKLHTMPGLTLTECDAAPRAAITERSLDLESRS